MIIQLLSNLLLFFFGFKIGKILAKKKFVEFLMDGIDEDIRDHLEEENKKNE